MLLHVSGHKKKAASLTLRPLHDSKGDTRATNAITDYHDSTPASSGFLRLSFFPASRHLAAKRPRAHDPLRLILPREVECLRLRFAILRPRPFLREVVLILKRHDKMVHVALVRAR